MKYKNENRQNFLLTFFQGEGYEEKEVNGYWLVKQWNGNTKNWQVAIYTKESFENYLKVGRGESKTQYQLDLEHLKSIK